MRTRVILALGSAASARGGRTARLAADATASDRKKDRRFIMSPWRTGSKCILSWIASAQFSSYSSAILPEGVISSNAALWFRRLYWVVLHDPPEPPSTRPAQARTLSAR